MKIVRIAVGTDFSKLGELATETALSLARRFGAAVHIVHVIDERSLRAVYPYTHMTGVDSALRDEEAAAVQKLNAIAAEDVDMTREVRIGIPAKDLWEATRAVQADLIVIASHGYGVLRRAILGSVASSLIRMSETPVLVVGQDRHSLDAKNIVVGVDLSPVTKSVIECAECFAQPGGHLSVVTAYEPPVFSITESPRLLPSEKELRAAEQKRIDDVKQHFPEVTRDVTFSIEPLAKAPASMAIIESAELLKADLIVLGASGHNAWHRLFLGSTANRVLANAECPVLIVPTKVRE